MRQPTRPRTTQQQKNDLDDYAGKDRIVSSQYLKRHYSKLPPPIKIKFSQLYFPSLLRATDGFREGELIIISGLTKNGKTLLAQSLTTAFSDSNVNCLWFSYEVPTRQFIESFPDDLFPRFFIPMQIHAHNIQWMEERIAEAWVKFGCRVVFIDHLHFLFDMARIRNSSLGIGAYVRRIKRFAVQNRLVIFLICHVTKVDPGKEISYNDLRDSSFIAQDSDSVFLVRRLLDEGKTELKIEFHRRTGVLQKKITLYMRGGLLWEQPERRDASLRY